MPWVALGGVVVVAGVILGVSAFCKFLDVIDRAEHEIGT